MVKWQRFWNCGFEGRNFEEKKFVAVEKKKFEKFGRGKEGVESKVKGKCIVGWKEEKGYGKKREGFLNKVKFDEKY